MCQRPEREMIIRDEDGDVCRGLHKKKNKKREKLRHRREEKNQREISFCFVMAERTRRKSFYSVTSSSGGLHHFPNIVVVLSNAIDFYLVVLDIPTCALLSERYKVCVLARYVL